MPKNRDNYRNNNHLYKNFMKITRKSNCIIFNNVVK